MTSQITALRRDLESVNDRIDALRLERKAIERAIKTVLLPGISQEIRNLIREHGPMTAVAIADRLSMYDRGKVQRNVHSMCKNRVIAFAGYEPTRCARGKVCPCKVFALKEKPKC